MANFLAGNLVYQIIGDTSKLDKSISKAEKGMKSLGSKLQGIGKSLTLGVTLPIAGIGVVMLKSASDAEEAQSKFDTVFSNIKKGANKSAKAIGEDYNIAETATLDLLSASGDLLKGLGFTQQEAFKLSKELTELSGDVASFKNVQGGAERVSTAFTKALLGERESLKEIGIAIGEIDIKQLADEKGITDLNRQNKALLTRELILRKSKDAIGDVARTSESFANQTRKLEKKIKDLNKEMGKKFLPIAVKVLEKVISLVEKFEELSDSNKSLILKLAGVAAAIGPVTTVIGGLSKSIGVLLPLLTGPAGLAVLVGVVLVGGFFALREEVRATRDELEGLRGDNAQGFGELIKEDQLTALQRYRKELDEISEAASNSKNVITKASTGADIFNKAVGATEASTKKAGEKLRAMAAALGLSVDIEEDLSTQILGVSLALDTKIIKLEKEIGATKDVTTASSAFTDALGKEASALTARDSAKSSKASLDLLKEELTLLARKRTTLAKDKENSQQTIKDTNNLRSSLIEKRSIYENLNKLIKERDSLEKKEDKTIKESLKSTKLYSEILKELSNIDYFGNKKTSLAYILTGGMFDEVNTDISYISFLYDDLSGSIEELDERLKIQNKTYKDSIKIYKNLSDDITNLTSKIKKSDKDFEIDDKATTSLDKYGSSVERITAKNIEVIRTLEKHALSQKNLSEESKNHIKLLTQQAIAEEQAALSKHHLSEALIAQKETLVSIKSIFSGIGGEVGNLLTKILDVTEAFSVLSDEDMKAFQKSKEGTDDFSNSLSETAGKVSLIISLVTAAADAFRAYGQAIDYSDSEIKDSYKNWGRFLSGLAEVVETLLDIQTLFDPKNFIPFGFLATWSEKLKDTFNEIPEITQEVLDEIESQIISSNEELESANLDLIGTLIDQWEDYAKERLAIDSGLAAAQNKLEVLENKKALRDLDEQIANEWDVEERAILNTKKDIIIFEQQNADAVADIEERAAKLRFDLLQKEIKAELDAKLALLEADRAVAIAGTESIIGPKRRKEARDRINSAYDRAGTAINSVSDVRSDIANLEYYGLSGDVSDTDISNMISTGNIPDTSGMLAAATNNSVSPFLYEVPSTSGTTSSSVGGGGGQTVNIVVADTGQVLKTVHSASITGDLTIDARAIIANLTA